MLPISSRAVVSGSSSSSLGAPSAVSPRVAASAATTRSVTSSWVSQRRSCLPSLVPRRGSDDASLEPRSRSSRASTSSTHTGTPLDRRGDISSHRHLHRGRVDKPAGAADPDQRPPLPGFHPQRAARRRSRVPPFRGRAVRGRTAAGPIHSHVPHGLIRCASTARSACASVPTVTASRAVSPAVTSTGSGSLISRSMSTSAEAATDTTHTSSTTWRQAGGIDAASLPVTASSARTGYSPGGGSGGIVNNNVRLQVLAGRQYERQLGRVGAPALGAPQTDLAVQRRVAAVAVNGKPQRHLRIRLSRDVLRMQVRDGRQAAKGCGAAVVQPVTCIQRLRRFGVGCEHGVVRLEHLRHVEPRQHRGDLVAVQRQRVRGESLNPWLLEQVDARRPRRSDAARSGPRRRWWRRMFRPAGPRHRRRDRRAGRCLRPAGCPRP